MAAQQRRATATSISAPIGGWNARDSLAEMPPLDAVTMVNMFPTPTDVTLRKGYVKASTGITGSVNSLMNYNRADGSYNLFAAAGTTIYDAKPATAVVEFTSITSAIGARSVA